MIHDPDYAKVYTVVRCLAWSHGYSAMLHGSFTRDLDLVLVPWSDTIDITVANLFAHITGVLDYGWKPVGTTPTQKPHNRLALTYRSDLFFGDPRFIDLSIFSSSGD